MCVCVSLSLSLRTTSRDKRRRPNCISLCCVVMEYGTVLYIVHTFLPTHTHRVPYLSLGTHEMHPEGNPICSPTFFRLRQLLVWPPLLLLASAALLRRGAGPATLFPGSTAPLPRSLRASSTLELRHDHSSGTVGAKSSPDLKLVHADRGEGGKSRQLPATGRHLVHTALHTCTYIPWPHQ